MSKVPIVAWSHSKLETFEQCPKKYYHLNVKKDFKEEFKGEAAEDGIRAHKAFEDFLCRGKKLPIDLMHHEPILKQLRDKAGDSYTEQKLAFDADFAPCGWYDKEVYGRVILDYMKVNGKNAVLIDHKFGKMHDKFDQLELFVAAVSIFLPDVENFTACYYWAQGRKFTRVKFARADLPQLWGGIIARVNKLEAAHKTLDFPAKQSGLCKRHCIVTSCPHNGRLNE